MFNKIENSHLMNDYRSNQFIDNEEEGFLISQGAPGKGSSTGNIRPGDDPWTQSVADQLEAFFKHAREGSLAVLNAFKDAGIYIYDVTLGGLFDPEKRGERLTQTSEVLQYIAQNPGETVYAVLEPYKQAYHEDGAIGLIGRVTPDIVTFIIGGKIFHVAAHSFQAATKTAQTVKVVAYTAERGASSGKWGLVSTAQAIALLPIQHTDEMALIGTKITPRVESKAHETPRSDAPSSPAIQPQKHNAYQLSPVQDPRNKAARTYIGINNAGTSGFELMVQNSRYVARANDRVYTIPSDKTSLDDIRAYLRHLVSNKAATAMYLK
jgi:hypothetical protein